MNTNGPRLFPVAGKRIFVAGHRGMVGQALLRRLAGAGCDILTVERRTVDLMDQRSTFDWLQSAQPDAVIVAAAAVGGIWANVNNPAEFIYNNLAIETNLIEGSRRAQVSKLLFLGSSCIYPKFAEQPIREEELLSGALESTNECYAIAKIAGIKLCQAYRRQYHCDFISAMPTNLYGPGDNYDPLASHVVPGLIQRIHQAKVELSTHLEVWGTGTPRREFLQVDDLADACVFLMEYYSDESHINVGTGQDITINDLVALIAKTVGWVGQISYITEKPDGTPRKLLDISRLSLMGWRATTELEPGIRDAYSWYLQHVAPG